MVIEKLKISIITTKNSFFKWRYNRKEFSHLNRLLRNVKREEFLKKRFVFNSVRPIKEVLDREFFLGKLLALNGAKVFLLLDDGILKHWDTTKIDDVKVIGNNITKNNFNLYPRFNKNNLNIIEIFFQRNILRKAYKTYNDKNLNIIFYSDILKSMNNENWQEVRKFAKSSTIRFFKNSELDFNNPIVRKYYNLSIENAILSKNVGEFVLKELKPDFFITSHGFYSTWGPAYELLKKNSIKSFVYAGKHSHSLDAHDIYFTDSKIQTLTRSSFWDDYKNTPVTKKMEEKVSEIFQSRIGHSSKDTKVYYNRNKGIFKINKNDSYKYHIAIFPSLIWDGNIQDRHIAFTGIIDWLISTINHLKNKNVKIYLKFHPAEVTLFQRSPKIQDLLKDFLDRERIENLVLIPTEKKIDPYEFLKSGIDLGICYDGILALEIPYLKIPVILGGVRGRFSVDDGNFTISSRKQYFDYLDNLEKLIAEFHQNYEKYYKNIIRYSYWYFFENVIKLPTLSKKNFRATNLLQLTQKDLLLNKKLLNIFTHN